MDQRPLKERARQAGYNYLLEKKDKHAVVTGVVEIYSDGYIAGVQAVLTALEDQWFQTEWNRGLKGSQTANILRRLLGATEEA